MNTLYCCCVHDAWLDVAIELKNLGYSPSYWIGWPEGKQAVIGQLSPEIFHDINNAWKGIFPTELGELNRSEIDGSELSAFTYDELMTIRMMERQDPDRHSFTFTERQYFYRRLLNQWIQVLKNNNIELVIFPIVPHRVFDYVIYTACKMLNINFLNFYGTVWKGQIIPTTTPIEDVPDFTSQHSNTIYDEVDQYIEKLLAKSYQDAVPDYMVHQKKEEKIPIYRKLLQRAKNKPSQLLNMTKELPIYWKQHGVPIEESKYKRYEVYFEVLKGDRFKKKIQKLYSSLCVEPDYQQKYVFVGLHYQPEATSVPHGNIYGDQLVLLHCLLKYLPNDTFIYVKEHLTQFMTDDEGQTGRTLDFYHALNQMPRVKLISTDEDTFKLIDNSIGVATLTGTIGIEAIVRGKPVLVFGNIWYQNVHGVLKVDSREKMELINNHLTHYIEDLELVRQQFHNIYNNTLRAHHYKVYLSKADISQKESNENLVNCITSLYPNENR